MTAKNVRNHPGDRYAVAYRKDGADVWLQTEPSTDKAIRARNICNEHEVANGREPKFYAIMIGEVQS